MADSGMNDAVEGEVNGHQQVEPQRILSIQSHVVSGYVGNKAAVFPLQLLGFDVDAIHSVQFSNHTGYPNGCTGERLDGPQLEVLWRGLQQNNLTSCIQHLLTGYMGTTSIVTALAEKVLPCLPKNVRYVCDPVLGDKGELYVPAALVDLYRTVLVPLADVITPNQYEAQLLTQQQHTAMESMKDVITTCQALHELGPSLVLLTSVELPDRPNVLTVVASECSSEGKSQMWTVTCPLLPGHFTGTGDLCAALWLAHTASDSGNTASIPNALERVVNTIFAILEETQRRSGETVHSRELCLIRAQRWIRNPPMKFRAEAVDVAGTV